MECWLADKISLSWRCRNIPCTTSSRTTRTQVVSSHGGAWIYNVTSNEELDRLLAMSPVYNCATYQVLPLAEMEDPATITGKAS